MVEKQQSQYQLSSGRGHHKNNHGNPWEDQGSQVTEDTNSNSNSNSTITNQGDGSDGLRIKINIKGIRAAAHINNKQPCLCHICNKGFSSGKALGGHMRIHALNKKQIHKDKEVTQCCKTQQQHLADVNSNPTCSLCRKTFSSMKSMYGHMRCHPERVRRGIQTPTTITSQRDATSFNSSDDSTVDISSSLTWGWSVTAKRGCKRLSSYNANSDMEVEEAAQTLMLLANGIPKPVLESGDMSMIAADQVELSSISLTKKLKIEEKSRH